MIKKNNAINNNQKALIMLLEKKGYLEAKDFDNIFELSFEGTKAKIKHWLTMRWIQIYNTQEVVYRYIKGENCPTLKEW